jgi:hypothetical protein
MARPHPQTVLVREPQIIYMRFRLCMPLEPVWHPAADRFGVPRSHPPGLQDSALRGRPLTAFFRNDDRNLALL